METSDPSFRGLLSWRTIIPASIQNGIIALCTEISPLCLFHECSRCLDVYIVVYVLSELARALLPLTLCKVPFVALSTCPCYNKTLICLILPGGCSHQGGRAALPDLPLGQICDEGEDVRHLRLGSLGSPAALHCTLFHFYCFHFDFTQTFVHFFSKSRSKFDAKCIGKYI